jgi:hypothetical protein
VAAKIQLRAFAQQSRLSTAPSAPLDWTAVLAGKDFACHRTLTGAPLSAPHRRSDSTFATGGSWGMAIGFPNCGWFRKRDQVSFEMLRTPVPFQINL